MIQAILLGGLGLIGAIIVVIVGVLGWVVLKLLKGELNLKIGNDTSGGSQTPPGK
ncbi:MAG TPA: hypothetical protein VMR81_01295 [Patescibacteria group bacterium]|jgi:hypothetical protein|nr:hypothetical protein [Patescibacteria group bacterium]